MLFLWILIAALVLISIFISSGIYMFRRIFVRADRTEAADLKAKARMERYGHPEFYDRIQSGKKWLAERPCKELFITSFDGLRLRARFYENPSPSGTTIVLSHGYKSNADYDFGSICPFYYGRGCNLLLIDSRAHAKSEGKFVTLGALERIDLRDWCAELEKLVGKNERVVLAGLSMGSTVSILAAASPGISENVCGVIADCGFISVRREMSDILKSVKFPRFPILYAGNIAAKLRLGIGIDDFSTVTEIKKLKVPVLFIHGDADDFVLPDNTLQNYNACPSPKELVMVKNARHCFSFLTDEELVTERISAFLDSLPAPAKSK
ncbi:MAG: alpha/beta hydrolase [Clostridiales bacterium]|nr:alpha/beta hydrolase [Clostridiales bacterium]